MSIKKITKKSAKKRRCYLAVYGKGSGVLVEIDAGDSGNDLRLLYVCAMAADGQTHQFM